MKLPLPTRIAQRLCALVIGGMCWATAGCQQKTDAPTPTAKTHAVPVRMVSSLTAQNLNGRVVLSVAGANRTATLASLGVDDRRVVDTEIWVSEADDSLRIAIQLEKVLPSNTVQLPYGTSLEVRFSDRDGRVVVAHRLLWTAVTNISITPGWAPWARFDPFLKYVVAVPIKDLPSSH